MIASINLHKQLLALVGTMFAALSLYLYLAKPAPKPMVNLPVAQANFINFILEHAQISNEEVLEQRKKLLLLYHDFYATRRLSMQQQHWLVNLAQSYKVANPTFDNIATWLELLKRVDIIPNSLVIAQAINESAWGRSRFAIHGNNYFGIWCYKRDCGLIPAERKAGATHEVKVFASPLDSVRSYMRNLNSLVFYATFRDLREALRYQGETLTGLALAANLINYSVQRDAYINNINAIINQYQLTQFDDSKNINASQLVAVKK